MFTALGASATNHCGRVVQFVRESITRLTDGLEALAETNEGLRGPLENW